MALDGGRGAMVLVVFGGGRCWLWGGGRYSLEIDGDEVLVDWRESEERRDRICWESGRVFRTAGLERGCDHPIDTKLETLCHSFQSLR